LAPNDYHLRSEWRVLGAVDEVYEVIANAEELPVWWPAAFVETLVLEPGAEDGAGRVVRVESRGWLPYNLHWHLRVDDVEPGKHLGFNVWGDFEGRGAWWFKANGAWTDVVFDWRVRVRKPVVRWLSYVTRRIFESNHRWAMARGEESLRLALSRRHAEGELLTSLPPPPAPVTYSGPLITGAVVAGLTVVLLQRRLRR
jgi:hypothetical protein